MKEKLNTSFKISQIKVIDAVWILRLGDAVCMVWCGTEH